MGGLGDTIHGGAATVTIAGAVGDIIYGGTGTALINAALGGQSITGGAGSATIWGGAGDTITAGTGSAAIDLGGGSETVSLGGGHGAALIHEEGTGSSANTADTIYGFVNNQDFLSYKNEGGTPAQAFANLSSVTDTTVGGQAAAVITLQDGTTMTLVGFHSQQINSTFFK